MKTITFKGKFIQPFCLGKDILDVGCGNGFESNGLRHKNYLGIDRDRKSIRYATEHFGNPNKKFVLMDIKDLDGYQKYDVIICLDVIEHMESSEGKMLLDKIYSLLKDRGVLLMITPNRDATLKAIHRIPLYHKHEYTYEELKRYLSKFDKITFKSYGGKLSLLRVLQCEFLGFVKKYAPYKLVEMFLDNQNYPNYELHVLNMNDEFFFIRCVKK